MNRMVIFLKMILTTFAFVACAQNHKEKPTKTTVPATKQSVKEIQTGAEQTEVYLPLLQGKRVGMVINQTSVIGYTSTVDSLLKRGVNIVKIFGPEHGFRGNVSAGIHVDNAVDEKTGIKVVSLYGKKRAPSKEDLADIDVIIFDIQDVGTRFYTYINTLQHVMEAGALHNKEVIILDRPNPNGFVIDGPILDPQYKSGIGLQPIPVAHGLTIGEYAQMLNGEGWLKDRLKCKITIIKNVNYSHDMSYELPISPSPNLNTQQAILLYPSTCLFEGIYVNHGRGTKFPFTVLGAPYYKGIYNFSFTPTGIKGMAENPIFKDETCYGIDLRNYDTSIFKKTGKINIQWVMELYQKSPRKQDFFNSKLSNQMGTIEKLIGVSDFRQQIIDGKSEAEIRASWEPSLNKYKEMRKKYLLYN